MHGRVLHGVARQGNKNKMKTQILKIKEIKEKENLYPRKEYDQILVRRYADEMKAGATFPPIKVTTQGKKFFLVDGKHRIGAYLINNEEIVEAIVLDELTDKEIFFEAVKSNLSHGKGLSEEDLESIKITLENFEYSESQISTLLRIPATKLKHLTAEKMERFDKPTKEISVDTNEREANITEERVNNRRRHQSSQQSFIGSMEGYLYGLSKKIEEFREHIQTHKFILTDPSVKEELKIALKNIDNISKTLREILGMKEGKSVKHALKEKDLDSEKDFLEKERKKKDSIEEEMEENIY